MPFSLLYMVLRVIFRLVPSGDERDRGVEILLLRHQVKVLRRKAGRPKFRRLDRLLLAAAARILPEDRWSSFIVTPQTLLRWHRELVRRKWTYRRTPRAGHPLIPGSEISSCAWPKRTHAGDTSGSRERCESSASASGRPRSRGCLFGKVSGLRPEEAALVPGPSTPTKRPCGSDSSPRRLDVSHGNADQFPVGCTNHVGLRFLIEECDRPGHGAGITSGRFEIEGDHIFGVLGPRPPGAPAGVHRRERSCRISHWQRSHPRRLTLPLPAARRGPTSVATAGLVGCSVRESDTSTT